LGFEGFVLFYFEAPFSFGGALTVLARRFSAK
jgi:hypothetical protein